MADETVRVCAPGHERHGQYGVVIAKRGNTYTVEFADASALGTRRSSLETFEGKQLRAAIRLRV